MQCVYLVPLFSSLSLLSFLTLLYQALRLASSSAEGVSVSDDDDEGMGPVPSARAPVQNPQLAAMPLGVWAEGGIIEAAPVAQRIVPVPGVAAVVREEWMVDPGQNKVQGKKSD